MGEETEQFLQFIIWKAGFEPYGVKDDAEENKYLRWFLNLFVSSRYKKVVEDLKDDVKLALGMVESRACHIQIVVQVVGKLADGELMDQDPL